MVVLNFAQRQARARASQVRASKKRRVEESGSEYDPREEDGRTSKRARTETSCEVSDSDEKAAGSPAEEGSIVGSVEAETILPAHFPSQTLDLPPQVYGGRFINRVNDRFMMKRELPFTREVDFASHLHQLDDYSPLVKVNLRLIRESHRRLQNFTEFLCGSCSQMGHDECNDNGFGLLCDDCLTGHKPCSKSMNFGHLLDSLEQIEATGGLSSNGK